MRLTHPFKDIVPSVDEFLFSKNETGIIQTINAFCHRVNNLSEIYRDRIDPNKFKGDSLELLVEYMIKCGGHDNRFGIYDYHCVTDSDNEDVGVDGYGIGENESPATVQVKYRTGDYVLTANADHLSNFLTASWFDYNVEMTDDKNMLIVTTGLKVDEKTKDKMLKNKVRVLNRESLREMFDNRTEWWKQFYESIVESRTKIAVIKNKIILRRHQQEACQSIEDDDNGIGKIILPTGTGKTIVEAEVIRREIEGNKETPILIKVNSSRILLCFQLFEEVFNYLNSYGIQARYMNFNSGNQDDKYYAKQMRKMGWVYRKIMSTTSPKEIKAEFEKCKNDGLPLIVFSTYHSSEKFASCDIIPQLTINDEAHNLVSEEFSKVAVLPTKKNFFFTATERTTESDEDVGMNNPDIFDNLIYTKSAKELIDAGEMCPPHLHIVRARNLETLDSDYDMMFRSIVDSFFAHEKKIRQISFDCDNLGAKILVVCRGQQDLIEMFNTKSFQTFKEEHPDIHLFALSSEFGLYNDGEYIKPPVTNVKKYNFIKKVKGLGNGKRCIIFHVDMIGEGIDVPGITGVMPFRNCQLSKFIQNVGRSTRLHPMDRKKFYAGEIFPLDKTKYIKPVSWIIMPSFLMNSQGFSARFKEILDILKEQYGYIPQEITHIDNKRGLDDDEDIDVVNEKNKVRPKTKSKINEFVHEFDQLSEWEQIIVRQEIEDAKEEGRKVLRKMGIIS